MSSSAGPGSITNGLVFAYDMGNNSKSFIGAPTTNLAEFPATGYNWVNSGAANYSDNDTNEQLPNVPNNRFFTSPIRVVSCQTTTASTQGQQCGYAFTSVSGSTTYTMSLWFKKNRDNMNSYGPYVRQSINNNWHGTFDYNGETNNALWPTNQWIRIKSTFTTSSNENGVYLSNYIGEYVGDKVCYAGGQLEQKSFASSLAQGTRSNTQSLIDQTNNITLTSTNLTYASDNTFSFNGSSYIDLNSNNIITGTNPFTVEVWYTTTGTTSDEVFGNYGSGSTSGTLWISGRYGIYISGAVYFPGAPIGAGTYCLTTTRDGSGNVNLYKNGILVNSGVLGSSIPVTYNFRIGADVNGAAEPFTGNIYSVKVYNRVLTQTEVEQNFNSLRRRYGI